MQSVTLSHGTISYQHQHAATATPAPPLLLLHGWGGSSRYWHTTMAHFSQTRAVYALDMPGYGMSPALAGDITNEQFAAIVIEFADSQHLDCFDLNAHSFGCSVASLVAARWSQRVRRLVLTCFSTFRNEYERRMVEHMLSQMGVSVAMWHPWMSLWHPWMSLWQSWMLLWRPPIAANVPSLYQTMAWRFFYAMPQDETLLHDLFNDFLTMDQRTSLYSIASALDTTITVALQAIAAPTLVIGARQDMVMPAYGVPIVANHIPHSRLAWIEHCGHLPMIEQPIQYHHMVASFLDDR